MVQVGDYESYNLAFSENIYTDTISQFVFNEDINVSGLTDNLGRPLSQLYLTVMKTDSNGLFTPISSGIETPFIPNLNTSNINTYLLNVPAINKIHNGGTLPFPSHIPLEVNINISGNSFYGDLVEYNVNEVQETTLAVVSHRFNTFNRETAPSFTYVSAVGLPPSPTNPSGTPPTNTTTTLGPRQEGYYYITHRLITIREFSSYIQQGQLSIDIIPPYAVNLGDGTYLWRDLLDIGFNESSSQTLDYPFLNGCHYMYDNYCFYVRRQDPFDNWGLYYSNFPSDPLGESMTNQYTVNSADNVC
jgi:hypothetical protein